MLVFLLKLRTVIYSAARCDNFSADLMSCHIQSSTCTVIVTGFHIFQVNDVDISPMSHEEAVMFLRQCGDTVKLRLYRDAAQTPVSALSPTEEVKAFKPKPLLR